MCMSIQEIERRAKAGELYSTLSRESWEVKLILVKTLKLCNFSELQLKLELDDIEDRCALCVSPFPCSCCPLRKVADGVGCNDIGSAYNIVRSVGGHERFVKAIENLISKLKEAEEFERSHSQYSR